MATIFGTIDVGGNGKEILLHYVSTQLGFPVSLDDFDFGVPERIDFTGTKYNTKIALAPKADSGFYGTKTIYYNRIHVSELGKITCVRGTATKVSHLLQQINEKYGILVQLSDIEDRTLPPPDPADPFAEVEVEFRFKESSIVFYDGTFIQLGEYDPSIIDPEIFEPFNSKYMFFADKVYKLHPQANVFNPSADSTVLEAYSVVIDQTGKKQITGDVTDPLNKKLLHFIDADGSPSTELQRVGEVRYESTYKNNYYPVPIYKGLNEYRNYIVGAYSGNSMYEAYCVDIDGKIFKRAADNTQSQACGLHSKEIRVNRDRDRGSCIYRHDRTYKSGKDILPR